MEASGNRGSDRPDGLPALVGVALATAALVWLVVEYRERAGGAARSAASTAELEGTVAALTRRIAELEAEHRTLASLAELGARAAPGGEPARSTAARSPAADLAAKPVLEEGGLDSAERARRIGDDAIARALEHAAVLPDFGPPALAEGAPGADASDEDAPPAPPPADVEPLIAAFNQLLRDAGLDGWKLLTAEPDPAGRALRAVVLAQLTGQGTAIGSLSADRLQLERDPATGTAGVELSGAKGSEGGFEVLYPQSRTRLEIPGILPLDLLAPCLRDLFGIGSAAPGNLEKVSGDQLVRAINRPLELAPGLALRLRSVDRLEDGTLRKAVIDLDFNEHGAATRTVFAESAWFELDPAAGYAELCCEGGEMLEKGLRRPLFRGRLRLPLRDIKPENWKGVPAVRPSGGP